MNEVSRVTPEQICHRLRSGEALLVCAYDDEVKFQRLRLTGAISLAEFRSLRPTLPRDQEIVFYCA
jgi:hypothetical protein